MMLTNIFHLLFKFDSKLINIVVTYNNIFAMRTSNNNVWISIWIV